MDLFLIPAECAFIQRVCQLNWYKKLNCRVAHVENYAETLIDHLGFSLFLYLDLSNTL
jgi:hypothetical protein